MSKRPKRIYEPIKERKIYCPICGNLLSPGESIVAINGHKQHRCSSKRLDAIDQANQYEGASRRSLSYSERLEIAEIMLNMTEE